MLLRRILFNCLFICFTACVSFWLGTLIGLHQSVAIIPSLEMYGSIMVVLVGLLTIAMLTTLPISPSPNLLLQCQAEAQPLLRGEDV